MAAPKIDKETCGQLRSEQATFIQSGILADIQRGPEWAKANLTAERIREIELFITLDEQIKFGCREVTLTGDALRAGEAARRLELNPNLDPTLPPPPEAPEPKSGEGSANAEKAGSEGAAATQPELKPKTERRAQPAVKPKANDAYVPPPEDENNSSAGAADDSAPSGTP